MFKRKSIHLTVMLLLLSLSLYGCGSGNNTNTASSEAAAPSPSASSSAEPSSSSPSGEAASRSITDELGNKLDIPTHPQRIVAPYLEDALLSLGIKPVAQWSAGALLLNYLQPQLTGIPKLDFVKLDPEEVASFEPDLFIIPFAMRVQNGAYDQYAKVAPTYVFQDATKDWRKTLLTLGDLLNRTQEANEALTAYDAKMASMKTALQDKINGKTAAIMLISDKSFSLMQEDTYSGQVIYGELGFQAPSSAKGNDWKELSLETLPDLNPDYIFLMQVDGADPLQNKDLSSIYSTLIWKNLKAVQTGKVYSVDRDYWINTGLQANQKVAEDVQKFLSAS